MKRGTEKIANLIGKQTGWRKCIMVIGAGGLAALAQAPYYLLPLFVAGFSVLVMTLDLACLGPRKIRSAFAAGWQFGFGYFLVGLYWLAFSFFVQAEAFAWMAPFAVMGMPAFLAFFSAGAAAVYVAIGQPGWQRAFLFSSLWMGFEYARGHILTGLPWNLPGQALAGTAVGIQTAAFYGVYGLSLVLVFLSVLPACLGMRGRISGKGVIVSLAGFAVLFTIGFVRMGGHPISDNQQILVRIVQPNIPQKEKIDPAFWSRNLEKLLASSARVSSGVEKAFVIWPENAVPVIDEVPEVLARIDDVLPSNAILVTGAVRRQVNPEGGDAYFNSIAFVPATPIGRRIIANYDKHHLVPFGEYLPLQGVLTMMGLAQLAPYEDGFTKGPGPRTLDLGGATFAPLICYETIFPGQLYPKSARPEWLLTVTNDAWFGDTAGPRQHLDQARLRAVETGLPMARSANTGISAMIDGVGRYRKKLPLYEAGIIEVALPRALKPTLYARGGDAFFLILALFFGGYAVFSPKRY